VEVTTMRSWKAVAGAVTVFIGLVLAILVGLVAVSGDSAVLHLALGVGFALFASAVFDFSVPRWLTILGSAAAALLAAIFALQGLADLTGGWLSSFAYGVLGQGLEGWLGYAFIVWCVGLVASDSTGWTRLLGVVVLAAVAGVEVYSFIVRVRGGIPPGVLRLVDLPLFVWLALEGSRRPGNAWNLQRSAG
jgi:hypothetical protein